MLDNERQDFIMNELRTHKVVYVTQLAKKCFVSPCTLRRDLETLEKMGLLHRAYGKATLAEHPSEEIPYAVRKSECHKEKSIIGSLAAELVKNGDFLLLDASSTVNCIIPSLAAKRDLSVVTNGAQSALDCQDMLKGVTVYCTGGVMNPSFRGFAGSAAIASLDSFRPDILFFSARAITLEDGVCDVNEDNVFLKRHMLKVSRKRVFLCDSRKLSRVSYRIICGLNELDCLITETQPPEEWVGRLEENGVELIYPGV